MRKSILLIGLLIAIIGACDVPQAYGDLRIRVTGDDRLLEGAEVTLYLNEEDYNLQQNPYLGPSLTDAEGLVSFFTIEDSVVFVNVQSGERNNWESKAIRRSLILTENGFNNAQSYDIRENNSSRLSSPEGKVWSIQEVFLNGREISEELNPCVLDNQLIFSKGGGFEERFNVNCEEGEPSSQVGTWAFNESQTQLIVSDGLNTESWNLITLIDQRLRVELELLIEGSFIEVEVIYGSS